MNTKEKLSEIIKRLKKEYPELKTALRFRNPFELLVATILSAQTTDVHVNKVRGTPRDTSRNSFPFFTSFPIIPYPKSCLHFSAIEEILNATDKIHERLKDKILGAGFYNIGITGRAQIWQTPI